MDIFEYIDRVKANFDKQPEPRYNMKKYFMGGSVIGKPGGLVEPGVMYYGSERVSSDVKTKKFKYKVSNQHGTFYTDKPGIRIGEKPLTQAEKTARYREKNPYKLKTTDIVVDGVKYTIPNNAMKPKNAKGFIKFLNKLEKDSSLKNYRKLIAKEPESIQRLIRTYRAYLQNEKAGGFSRYSGNLLREVFEELKLPKKSANFLKNVTTADIKAEIIKTSATPQRAANQKRKSAEKVIAINNQFKQNPKITLEQLTKNLYKTEFTKADKAGKLRLLTTVSDDVAKYLEALKNAREIPQGLKSQFIAPTGKNLDNIKKYITSQSEGFRFREGTLRSYKYSIRDSILGFKQGYTKNLENKLKIKGVLDHAVGLSATYELAPGYTGLYQDLEKKLNDVKGTDIDKDFTRVLREVIKDKNFKNVDEYNKQASKFYKTHKGKIDVPFIRKGGDPTKLVTSFYDLDKASQKNILKLAKGPEGIAIETKGKSIKYLRAIGCPEPLAAGGRVGFQDGTTCLTKGLQKINEGKLKQGSELRNFSKLVTSTGAKTPQALLKFFGAIGVAGEAGLIGVETALRMGMGDTFSEALKRSLDYLIPGNLTLSADMDKISRELGPQTAQVYGNVQNYYNKIQSLNAAENAKEQYQNLAGSEYDYFGDYETEIKNFDNVIEKAKENVSLATVTSEEQLVAARGFQDAYDASKAKSPFSKQKLKATRRPITEDISGLNLDFMVDDLPEQQGTFMNFRNAMLFREPDLRRAVINAYEEGEFGQPGLEKTIEKADNAYNESLDYIDTLQIASLSELANTFGQEQVYGAQGTTNLQKIDQPVPFKRQSSYYQSPLQLQEENRLIEEGARLGASSGGLANLTRTIPPKKGPQSQGLAYLMKNGKR